MNTPQKPWSDFASKPLQEVGWSDDTLLVVENTGMGASEAVRILYKDGAFVRPAAVVPWPRQGLRAHHVAVIEAHVLNALMRTMVHTYGVQGEIFEAFG